MNAFRFQAPYLLLLLLLLVPLVFWVRRPRRGTALRLSTLGGLQGQAPNWRVRLSAFLWSYGWLLSA